MVKQEENNEKEEDEEKILDPIMVARGKRLKEVRHLMRMTLSEFASFCGAGRSTVGQWEQGRLTGLANKSAKQVADALKDSPVECTEEWLLYGEKPAAQLRPLQPRGTPILTSTPPISSMGSALMTAESLKAEVAAFAKSSADALVLQVKDNAMAPAFRAGDYVGGYRCLAFDSTELVGEVCIAQTLDGQLLLRCFDGPSEQHYRLSTLQIDPQTQLPEQVDVDLVSLALVLRLWRPLPKN